MALIDAVPAGMYGKAALEALDLWTDVQGQVVQTDHVRSALRLVGRGECDGGSFIAVMFSQIPPSFWPPNFQRIHIHRLFTPSP
ncbi:hypothetical protein N9W43_00720 [Litoricolaceae bacterium]|nr:hypothetical protein [Litorivicinaceae bacterium]